MIWCRNIASLILCLSVVWLGSSIFDEDTYDVEEQVVEEEEQLINDALNDQLDEIPNDND